MRTAIIIDSQDVSDDVLNDMGELWADNFLGNDHCYYTWWHEEDKDNYPNLAKHIEDNDVLSTPGQILIHFWW